MFIISLTQPAFYIDRTDYDAWSNSFILLIMGWLGAMVTGGGALAWFANPFILASWIVSSKYSKLSVLFGIVATLFALSFLFTDEVITSEAGTYSKITEYKAGYWLWFCSIVVFTTGMLIMEIRKMLTNKK